jgi:hypothetical protein
LAASRPISRIWLSIGLIALVAVIGGTALALNVAIFTDRAPNLAEGAGQGTPAATGDWRGALQAVPAKQSYDRLDEDASVAPVPAPPAPAAAAEAGTVGALPPVTSPAAEAPAPAAETPTAPSLLSAPDPATPASPLFSEAPADPSFDLRGPAAPTAPPPSDASAPAKAAPVKAAPVKPSAALSGAPMPLTPSLTSAGQSSRATIPPGPAVITSAVKIRGGPDNGAAVVGSFAAGDTVTVLRCDFWCEVTAGTKHGYVYQRFIAARP